MIYSHLLCYTEWQTETLKCLFHILSSILREVTFIKNIVWLNRCISQEGCSLPQISCRTQPVKTKKHLYFSVRLSNLKNNNFTINSYGSRASHEFAKHRIRAPTYQLCSERWMSQKVALDVHASHVSATLVVSVRALATFLLVSL